MCSVRLLGESNDGGTGPGSLENFARGGDDMTEQVYPDHFMTARTWESSAREFEPVRHCTKCGIELEHREKTICVYCKACERR